MSIPLEEQIEAPRGSWVLLTDDSPTVCQMLTKLVSEMGFSSHQLKNYLDLPRLLRSDPPALVILDLERPGGLSGPAIGRFIRQYETSQIPIVVFSSLSRDVREAVQKDLGADATVGKQENLDQLRAIIARLPRPRMASRVQEMM